MWNKIGGYIKSFLKGGKEFDAIREEFTDLLISSDLGVKTAEKLVQNIKSSEDFLPQLRTQIENILKPCEKNLTIDEKSIILICGVNGSGKTTTIAKLVQNFKKDNINSAIVAADTFRAAAVEQLEIWAHRLNAPFYKGEINADPSSVIYNAITQNKDHALFIDTAGRLHNKSDLMQELNKIERVIKKVIPEAPHEVILVLDATTGMNLINQVKFFNETVSISGLIMTKLDGTAKGGIIVNIAETFRLPIYFIGTGERADDLEPFSAQKFTQQLLGDPS